jgi:hypothetical protein
MGMASGDCRHVTQLADARDCRILYISDRIPQEVARGCAHEVRLLTDPYLRLSCDPEQITLELG